MSKYATFKRPGTASILTPKEGTAKACNTSSEVIGPRSQNDYLEIATQFHTVLLSDVPYMPVSMASPARRFTWLVDVLYDRRVKLILSAAVPPEQLYTEGPLAHEFPRTVSRLNEMQSKEFLALERRVVDTGLT